MKTASHDRPRPPTGPSPTLLLLLLLLFLLGNPTGLSWPNNRDSEICSHTPSRFRLRFCVTTSLKGKLEKKTTVLFTIYYYLRVLYFANFCDLEKIAKISTRKNCYRHIWHSGVCTITNCKMFATVGTCIIILFWSFLPFFTFFLVPSRACKSYVWWNRPWQFHEQT